MGRVVGKSNVVDLKVENPKYYRPFGFRKKNFIEDLGYKFAECESSDFEIITWSRASQVSTFFFCYNFVYVSFFFDR